MPSMAKVATLASIAAKLGAPRVDRWVTERERVALRRDVTSSRTLRARRACASWRTRCATRTRSRASPCCHATAPYGRAHVAPTPDAPSARSASAIAERPPRRRAATAIVERNFRTRYGELDLVAADRCARSSSARSRRAWRAIGRAARARSTRSARTSAAGCARLAREWLAERPPARPSAPALRFDAIGVTVDRVRRARRARARRGRVLMASAPTDGLAQPLERELLVGDRRERQPVERRDAVRGDRRAVLGRRVADVRGEVPARVAVGGAAHVAVARDLGEDRGRRDRRAAGVAADHGALLVAEVGRRGSRRPGRARPSHATPRSAERSASRLVTCRPRASIAAHAAERPRHPRGGAQDERVELLAAGLGVLLGVVQRGRARGGRRA